MSQAADAMYPDRPGDETPLAMFDRTVAELGDQPLMFAFETPLPTSRVAELVDGLAYGLGERGVKSGDRVALYLQNDPQFVIAMLAAWRLGATVIPCNPMLRERELHHHLGDAGASAMVALDSLWTDVASRAELGLDVVVTTGARDLAGDGGERATPSGTEDLIELAERSGGARGDWEAPKPEAVAVLTYTSGTTGPPKGAMNTHGNIAWSSRIYESVWEATAEDRILAIAPLYHVTGLTAHIGVSLASGAAMILAHRFDAAASGRLTEAHGATLTAAAITAFMAIANSDEAAGHDFSTLRHVYSGGAPIPPAVVETVKERTGMVVKPVYGLTESTGPTHITPPGESPPVHETTGALSVGKDCASTSTRLIDGDGNEVARGEEGEVAISGPQIVPGYWNRPDETANAIRDGELRTGDIGIMDEDGWLYLVDRRKDMIIASGFKVWPREVEDVLYEHPAVREAAVVGVADSYRGETVWAYVSLKQGASVEPEELVAHCKAALAAYKYPRTVVLVDELPKTLSGKILRRELRDRAQAG